MTPTYYKHDEHGTEVDEEAAKRLRKLVERFDAKGDVKDRGGARGGKNGPERFEGGNDDTPRAPGGEGDFDLGGGGEGGEGNDGQQRGEGKGKGKGQGKGQGKSGKVDGAREPGENGEVEDGEGRSYSVPQQKPGKPHCVACDNDYEGEADPPICNVCINEPANWPKIIEWMHGRYDNYGNCLRIWRNEAPQPGSGTAWLNYQQRVKSAHIEAERLLSGVLRLANSTAGRGPLNGYPRAALPPGAGSSDLGCRVCGKVGGVIGNFHCLKCSHAVPMPTKWHNGEEYRWRTEATWNVDLIGEFYTNHYSVTETLGRARFLLFHTANAAHANYLVNIIAEEAGLLADNEE